MQDRENTKGILRITTKKIIWVNAIFLFMMENCFCLIDKELFHIAGVFAYSDIWLIMFLIYFGWKFIKYRDKKTNFCFGRIIICLCIMVIIAAIQQNVLTGQNIWIGLRPQRNYFIILMAYFPLRKMFSIKDIQHESLFDMILLMGVVSAGIYILQKVIGPEMIFIHATATYSRNGMRLYTDNSVIGMAVLIAAQRFAKLPRIRYLVYLMICLGYMLWVSQGRLEFMSLVMAIIVGVLLIGHMSKKKITIVMGLAVVMFVFLMSGYANNLWNTIMMLGTATAQQGNTMAIRFQGHALYIGQLMESVRTFMLGCGYPSQLYNPAASKAGFLLNIFLADNGIFGFAYIYGVTGVVLVIILVGKMMRMAKKIYRLQDDAIPIMYICLLVLMGYNILHWYWDADGTFLLVLMLCVLEQEKNQKAMQSM